MANEQEVWGKIMEGDAEAFNAFYRDNQPRLQAFIRQLVGSRQAAEDVVQETFVQMWKRPHGFHPESGTLRAYLYGIGRKQAAEWWRRQTSIKSVQEGKPEIGYARDHSVVSDAFGRLPEEQRTLLWLREVEGQSYAELATALEIPLGTVRSRLFAAREALRKIWHNPR